MTDQAYKGVSGGFFENPAAAKQEYEGTGREPNLRNRLLADMHTHSEHSHDSACRIEEMCLSEIEKGTRIFAVTDHFDAFAFDDGDIFTPIKESHDQVKVLREKYKGACLLLAGVEIGEGFWFLEQYKKILHMVPFDVIIGSVHCVRCKNLEIPYSKIDFSQLSKEEVYQYLDCYFHDMITMTEEMDFDILAHLTCPLRYIKGKFGISVDLKRYDTKITQILSKIIDRNIALEVNTSAFGMINDFMPSAAIIEQYYRMGGRLITLGSDAHTPEDASQNFDQSIGVLQEIGFKNICYFKDRTINKINI